MHFKQTLAVSTVAVILLALIGGFAAALVPAGAIPSSTDLRQGWYSQLPPVTAEMLEPAVSCLVEAGAPPNPTLETHVVPNPSNIEQPLYSPTEVVWQSGNRRESTTAVLTWAGADVALGDLKRAFPAIEWKHDAGWVADCVRAQAPVVAVSMVNPIDFSTPREGCACWASKGDAVDKFNAGATFSDGSGTYLKRRGGWAFVSYGYWEKVG